MSWPTYGSRPSYHRQPRPKAVLPVYEVNEDDWDEDGNYIGGDGGEDETAAEDDATWEGDGQTGYDAYEEEPQGGPSRWQTVTTHKPKDKGKQREKSDVADGVYFDDLALVNCWESALDDYKVSHAPAMTTSARQTTYNDPEEQSD